MSDLISDPPKMTFANDCRCMHRGHQPDCPIHGTPQYGYPDVAPSVSSSAPTPTWDEMASMFPDNSKRADRPRGSSAEPAPPDPGNFVMRVVMEDTQRQVVTVRPSGFVLIAEDATVEELKKSIRVIVHSAIRGGFDAIR